MNFKDYEPLFLSELEEEYPKLLELLKQQKTFIINGPESCGKFTILIKHIEFLKLNYKIVDSDISYENFKDNYTLKSKNVLLYLIDNNKDLNSDIIILRNFEKFDDKIKEYVIENRNKNFYILISNRYTNSKLNIIKIYNPSYEYLCDIYLNIYFLELQKNNNSNHILDLEVPLMYNFHQLKTYLYLNLSIVKQNENKNKNENISHVLDIQFDSFRDISINDIMNINDFNTKVLSVAKLNSVAVINNNLAYNINCIHDIADAYEYILESFNYYNFTVSNYYEIFNTLNILAPVKYLDKNKKFEINQTNFYYVKKKNKLNYIN